LRRDPEFDRLNTELHAARLAQISRDNALHSTGPVTHNGKAISSLNAVKTGLTGRTVLLHSDDADVYRQHLAAYAKEYQSVGLREQELVQSLADTQWRLQRIPGLEMAIYAQGRAENQEYCALHATAGASLIELGTFLNTKSSSRTCSFRNRVCSAATNAKEQSGTLQAKTQIAPVSGPQQRPSDASASNIKENAA